MVARGLLHAASGLQLNSTKLDESLLSGLAAVVAGIAEQLEEATTQQAAAQAQQAVAQAAQSAAITNVTEALAAAQVRLAQGC